jgi:streptogramin lyase
MIAGRHKVGVVAIALSALVLLSAGVTFIPKAQTASAETIATAFSADQAPLPTNAAANPIATLNGDDCPSAGISCVAVGSYDESGGDQDGLIETLSAFVWTPMAAALPSNAIANQRTELNSVSCAAPGVCMAVGEYIDKQGNEEPLIESLASGVWTPSPGPAPGGSVAAAFDGISCPAAGSCTAVGDYLGSDGKGHGILAILSGGAWITTDAPLPAGGSQAALSAVSCPDSGDCMASGSFSASGGGTLPLIETLSASVWSASEPPIPPDATTSPSNSEFLELNGISCSSVGTCVAVGDYVATSGNPHGSLGLLFETLSPDTSPVAGFEGSPSAELLGVSCPSGGTCTGAGARGDGNGLLLPNIPTEPPSAAPLPSNANATTEAELVGISCSGSSACLAVGSYQDSGGATQAFFDTEKAPQLTEYTDPSILFPKGFALGPDGAVWFSSQSASASSIGRIAPDGVVSNFTDPNLHAAADLAAGPDGAMWITEGNAIGRITMDGTVSTYTDPRIVEANGIVAGPDGAMWFTNENTIGRITMTGAVSIFSDPTISQAQSITAGPDGALWFTNTGSRSIGRITTAGHVSNFVPPVGSVEDFDSLSPQTITSGPDGALWAIAGNSIVRLTTSGAFSVFGPSTGYQVGGTAITVGSDGALWFVDGEIGRITTSGVASFQRLPDGSFASGITTGSDGAVWFGADPTTIGRIATSLFISPPSLPSGLVGSPYSAVLSATNGSPPYEWSVSGGRLPPGLSLSLDGVISGTSASAGTYTFSVTATDSSNPGITTAMQYSIVVSPGPPGPYSPLAPVRICDTRGGLNGDAAQCNGNSVASGGTKTIDVAGHFGVPADATAVVLNITVVNPTASGYLTAYPTGAPQPNASNLNFTSGEVVPNLVEVGTGTDGDVTVFSSSRSDLVVDLEGYTSPAAQGGAGLYNALTGPARICDTRAVGPASPPNQCNNGVTQAAGRVTAAQPLTINVANGGNAGLGTFGVPASATAAVLNITDTNPTGAGYMTAYPQGTAEPNASNLNFAAGQTTANRVIVPLSASGDITVATTAPSDLVVDVSGYYSAAGGSGGQFTSEGAPVRVCDTRPVTSFSPSNQCSGLPIGPGGVSTLNLTQLEGATGIPAAATAVVVNLTAVDPTQPTFLTVFPLGPVPNSSDLNPAAGENRANLVVATVNPTAGSTKGQISIYNQTGRIDVIVDVLGWYSSP